MRLVFFFVIVVNLMDFIEPAAHNCVVGCEKTYIIFWVIIIYKYISLGIYIVFRVHPRDLSI